MRSGRLLRAVLLPLTDAWRGLERCLERGALAVAWAGAGLLAGWWVYVPAHELLHAAACQATGGEDGIHRATRNTRYSRSVPNTSRRSRSA